jgi:multidrug efflux pump subunit AcrA (membrane-fusion protein)
MSPELSDKKNTTHKSVLRAPALVALSLTVAALFFAGVAAAQPPPTKVVLEKAKMVEAPVTITLVGPVRPARSSRVASELSGVVAEMPVREGDRVEQGQPLCLLNTDSLKFQLASGQARLKALASRHEELLAGTRKEDIARFQALHEEAIAERDRWQFEFDRVERLYSGSESNAKEISDTRASFLAADQRRMAAKAAFDLAQAGPRQEVIAQAAFDVAEQQAAASRLETDLKKAVIRAPFSGHIVSRAVEVGEWVPAGGTVATMVELSTVLVWVDAPESTLPFLEVGAPARVRIDALNRSFDGVIKHVMREADRAARTFPIEVELQNQNDVLAAGMFARATVPAGPSKAALAVPKDTLVTSDGTDRVGLVVQTPQGSTAMLAPVSIGASVGDWITITSGNIREGDPVVVRGTENLSPFSMPVVIVDEQGTPVTADALPPAPSVQK